MWFFPVSVYLEHDNNKLNRSEIRVNRSDLQAQLSFYELISVESTEFVEYNI